MVCVRLNGRAIMGSSRVVNVFSVRAAAISGGAHLFLRGTRGTGRIVGMDCRLPGTFIIAGGGGGGEICVSRVSPRALRGESGVVWLGCF